jgi:hypothetical protein
LATCTFIHRRENVLLTGRTGWANLTSRERGRRENSRAAKGGVSAPSFGGGDPAGEHREHFGEIEKKD